ncbi:MAG: N-acetyl sugar amidotransferase [Gammaproteobacteria bacterium]|nr:N-acetyl sugar amidotransferase [Gammaproteobacteria bacterium]
MRYCRRCILPDTRPGVAIGADGVCHGCHSVARKQRSVDWAERAAEFTRVVEHARSHSHGYDCLIPVSGGKDSYWQVVKCLAAGLHPLTMTYVVAGQTDLGRRNLENLVRIGVDHVAVRVNPAVERRFIERAFRRTGTSGLPAHMAIYSMPLRLALRYDIPLVVYGENSAIEYGSEDESLAGAEVNRRWLDRFGVTHGTTAADWIDEDLSERELMPYVAPSAAELAQADLRAIFLGYYFHWDVQESYRVATAHGFCSREEGARVGTYDYVNIDDDFIAIHHHLKWYKFGITRSWDNLSVEIRNGRLTREQALERLRQLGDETPQRDIEAFAAYLGISVAEYYAVCERFRNRDIWTRRNGRWEIDGFLIQDWPWPADAASP